ncbi:hypothetical protein QYF36_018991 [Acer negundo]|nr:hypothetical protein QYF36_018991 [Acer negundo]
MKLGAAAKSVPIRHRLGNPLLFSGGLSTGGGGGSRAFVFQGDGMDLSKVGEKILRSVRSARSLGLLPSTSDRPDSRGSEQQQQQQLLLVLLQDCLLIRVEELEKQFYEEAALRLAHWIRVAEHMSCHVMEHHEVPCFEQVCLIFS